MFLKRFLILVNLFIIAASFWMGQKQKAFEMDHDLPTLPLVSYQAPPFRLETFQGDEVSFEEDLLGKPLFINFWASWCPPCKAEMPDLVEVANLYSDKVTFIGINVATQDSSSQSKEFIEIFNVPYPNLIDKNGEVSRLYQVPPIPTTLVLDKDGTIVYRKLGGMTKTEMIAAVEKAIKGENLDAR